MDILAFGINNSNNENNTKISIFPIVTLEEIAAPHKGAIKIGPFGSQLKKEDLSSQGYKVYGQENIIEDNFTIGERRISEAKFLDLKTCQLFPGDVILTMMGTIGKCSIFPQDAEVGIMDSHLLRIQVNPKLADVTYIAKVISDKQFVGSQITQMSHGSIMSGLSSSIVRQLRIPLPSISEQKRIVAILSDMDETIALTDKLIEQLRQLKQELMEDLLTRGIGHTEFKETELGQIPHDWEVTKLGDVCAIIGGSTPSRANSNYWNGSIFWATPTDITALDKIFISETKEKITQTGFKESALNLLPIGTVLMTSRATIGYCAITTIPMTTNQGFTNFICSERINNIYLFYLLNSLRSKLIRLAGGSTFLEISKAEIKSFKISLPPLQEQKQIANILTDVDTKIEKELEYKAGLEGLKQDLTQNLLSGQVRVPTL